jgi:hypothetical protein
MALICGVRPGAIDWSTYRQGSSLRRKDLSIKKDLKSTYGFELTIELQYMNRADVRWHGARRIFYLIGME